MNKIEILKKLLGLLENGELIEISAEIEKLSKAFYAIYNSEKKESGSPEKDSDIDAESEKLNSDIIAAFNSYKSKKMNCTLL